MLIAPLKKIPLRFYKNVNGNEPVRDWLKELPELERHAIGHDLMRLQWRWPVGTAHEFARQAHRPCLVLRT